MSYNHIVPCFMDSAGRLRRTSSHGTPVI